MTIIRGPSSPPDDKKELIGLIRRAQATGIFRHRNFEQFFSFLRIDPDDAEVREIAIELIEDAEMTDLLSPDPFRATNPLSSDELPGILTLGLIPPNRVPWMIYPDMLTNHILITGRSGGGKSNLVLLILAQLLRRRHDDQSS